ncbi:hypothetical protein BZA05DRAFT_387215 [Tricharina praecox]|uniref:uncharacterized protein n=1 Tax=Tricharina praecox TaxID=43433 RepID=UPI00222024BE|nr:uncharacterized protein BZA05DRAFT_387215 [Tricharina praecox]KAI5857089.1 hypothetical protein BZA05DRAFT_387215 [Tricharina praecox]
MGKWNANVTTHLTGRRSVSRCRMLDPARTITRVVGSSCFGKIPILRSGSVGASKQMRQTDAAPRRAGGGGGGGSVSTDERTTPGYPLRMAQAHRATTTFCLLPFAFFPFARLQRIADVPIKVCIGGMRSFSIPLTAYVRYIWYLAAVVSCLRCTKICPFANVSHVSKSTSDVMCECRNPIWYSERIWGTCQFNRFSLNAAPDISTASAASAAAAAVTAGSAIFCTFTPHSPQGVRVENADAASRELHLLWRLIRTASHPPTHVRTSY